MNLIPTAELAVAGALKAGADEAEAFVTRGYEIGVTLEAGAIKSASRQTRDGVGIRAFKNKGLGFAYVNSLDESLVKIAAQNAASLAKASLPDAHNEMPSSVQVGTVEGLYDVAAESFDVADALRHATDMLRVVREYDSRAAVEGGGFEAAAAVRAVVNSRGIKVQESRSLFSCVLTTLARDGDDVSCMMFEVAHSRKVSGVNPAEVALSAAKQAVSSLGAKKTASFKGTMVLHPFAVEELIAHCLLSAVDAGNVQKGMSNFAGKLGAQVAAPLLTIEDNGLLPGETASLSFDREGIPPKPLYVLRNGVLESYLHNSYTAKKDEVASNGHAAGGMRSLPTIGPANVVIKAGAVPLKKLLGEIKRGVLVQRFSGFPHMVTGDFSGVVKGGFLIENGELADPLTETLISGNVFELMKQIVAVSQECRKVDAFLTAPYVSVEGVSITGG